MREIILFMTMSFDGFIAGPQGELDWMISPDHDREADILALLDQVDTALVGHGVYREMVQYWPTADGEFADRLNAMPKIVISGAREELAWNNATQLLIDDGGLSAAVVDLKQQPGADIVLYGGTKIVQSLTQLGLIDEYRLVVQPVALSNGKPLFKDLTDRVDLQIVQVRPYASGGMLARFRAARATPSGHLPGRFIQRTW